MEIEHICANVTEEIRDLKDISEDTVTCVRELTMSLKPLVAQDKEYKDLRQKALARIITGSAWTVFAAIAFLVFLGIKHYFGLDA